MGARVEVAKRWQPRREIRDRGAIVLVVADGGGATAEARAREPGRRERGSRLPRETAARERDPGSGRSHRALAATVHVGGSRRAGTAGRDSEEGGGRLLYKEISRGKVPEIWQMAGYRKRGLVRLTRGGSAAAYDGVM